MAQKTVPTTAAAFSPLLRPQLMQLAKATADYFQWQIGIESLLKKYPSRVLFGAGNMCRNYMKCYGETYPPLFICANSPDRWGTEFCGLEIRPPESLRELPEDCGLHLQHSITGRSRDSCGRWGSGIRWNISTMSICPLSILTD